MECNKPERGAADGRPQVPPATPAEEQPIGPGDLEIVFEMEDDEEDDEGR